MSKAKKNDRNGIDGNLLNMEEAIKLLKTSKPTFYRWLRSGKIKGMKVGRQWRFQKEDIHRFLKGLGPEIALKANPQPLLEDLIKILKELGKKGFIRDFELDVKDIDGSPVPCSLNSRLIVDENGKPERVVGSLTDLRHRKEAETRIRQLSTSLEQSPVFLTLAKFCYKLEIKPEISEQSF